MRAWPFLVTVVVCCSPRIDDPDLGDIPGAPEAGAPATSSVTTFAVNALFLGDATRDGVEWTSGSSPPWITFGYDLDDRVTVDFSTDVCTPTPGSLSTVPIDGDDGIDNSFGANLLFLVGWGTGSPDLTRDATNAIAGGQWTLQIRLVGLSGDSTESATGLAADTFLSGPLGSTPAFDMTTSWPVRPSTRVRFDTAYVDGGTVVLRDAEQPLVLPIALLNYFYSDPHPPVVATLSLRISAPVITFELGDGGIATHGVIAGVLAEKDALDTTNAFAGELGNCSGAFTFEVSTAEDILADGTNAPGTPCSGISIGLGFTAKQVGDAPETGVDPAPSPDPCADGGLDGGTDAD